MGRPVSRSQRPRRAVAQRPTIRGHGEMLDWRRELWDRKRGELPFGRHVPPPDHGVGPARDEGLAVGCEDQRLDAARRHREHVALTQGLCDVPELDRPVVTPRREPSPAVQEGDPQHQVGVPFQRRPGFAALDLPQPDGVRAACRQIQPVGGERDRQDDRRLCGLGARSLAVPAGWSSPTSGPQSWIPRRGIGRRVRRPEYR